MDELIQLNDKLIQLDDKIIRNQNRLLEQQEQIIKNNKILARQYKTLNAFYISYKIGRDILGGLLELTIGATSTTIFFPFIYPDNNYQIPDGGV